MGELFVVVERADLLNKGLYSVFKSNQIGHFLNQYEHFSNRILVVVVYIVKKTSYTLSSDCFVTCFLVKRISFSALFYAYTSRIHTKIKKNKEQI